MPRSIHTQQYQLLCDLMMEARDGAGLTQTELAEKLGRPQSYVSKYEIGERRLDVVEFLEVMRALGVDFPKAARLLKRVNKA